MLMLNKYEMKQRNFVNTAYISPENAYKNAIESSRNSGGEELLIDDFKDFEEQRG